MTIIALLFSIIVSFGSLAWGFVDFGLTGFARWILFFGAIWLIATWRRWNWFASFGLFFAVLISAFGLWHGLVPGWMFSGGIFALFAWDMTDFRRRMLSVTADDNTRALERRHIARISLLSIIGLFLASIAMLMRVKFTFEWGAFLVFVTLLGLSQLAGWLKK